MPPKGEVSYFAACCSLKRLALFVVEKRDKSCQERLAPIHSVLATCVSSAGGATVALSCSQSRLAAPDWPGPVPQRLQPSRKKSPGHKRRRGKRHNSLHCARDNCDR